MAEAPAPGDRASGRSPPALFWPVDCHFPGRRKLLKNRKDDRVATVVEISGSVSNPNSSVWQILGKAIENAFIKAILPGFERELSIVRKKK